MSVSVYAGPYFRMTIGKKEISERHLIATCQCHNRHVGMRSNFCSECGTPFKVVTSTALANDICYGDIQQAMIDCDLCEDDLACLASRSGSIVLAPNLLLASRKTLGIHWDSYDGDPKVLLDETTIDIAGDKAKLATVYARHYEVLKGLRAPERVTIEWGVVVTEE